MKNAMTDEELEAVAPAYMAARKAIHELLISGEINNMDLITLSKLIKEAEDWYLWAAEMRLRAERRLGELLNEMEG
jgi:hypothetical protein